MEEENTGAVLADEPKEAVAAQQDDTQDTGQVDDTPAHSEGEAPAESEKKSRNQNRREKMARLERERDEAKRKAEEYQGRLAKAKETAASGIRPSIDAFETHEEYLVALGAFEAGRQMDARQEATLAEEAQQAEQELNRVQQQESAEIAASWKAEADAATQRYADFWDVVNRAPMSPGLTDIVLRMNQSADVAYQLGLNPELSQQLSAMNPVQAAVELGRIEATLNAPQPKRTTSAPDPVAPVTPKAGATTDPENMTAEQYAEWRASGGTFNL